MRTLVICLLALSVLWSGRLHAQDGLVVEIAFRVSAPGASSVEVIGDFNGWQPGSHLLRGPDAAGIWSATFRITAATRRIEYQYLVNGRDRLIDHERPVVSDGFGGKNNVQLLP